MLTSIRLQDFRCFESLDLEAPEAGAILIGNNAQGKTSILEAICMLVRLHSPRTHRMGSLARFNTGGFGIAGNPWRSERRVRHSRTGLELKADDEIRQKKSDYLHDGGRIVWMGNEDLELVRGPGEGRRRYLDFIGSQLDPDYLHSWSRYRRALQAKNLLLKESRLRDSQIHAYEEILIDHGSHIMRVRDRIVKELGPLCAEAQKTVSGRQEPLKIDYLPASGEDLRESMHQAHDRERRLRQSVAGPHRDEISLRIHDMPANEFASEGQQRTLALALKLGQGSLLAEHQGAQPIYLLDDIFGELDVDRRNALMSHLPKQAQIWITTTHLDWMGDTHGLDDLQKITVDGGKCA